MAPTKWKRSTRACITCRSRKVRCDLETYGSPCSNCRFNNIVCQAAGNNRRKKQLKNHCKKCSGSITEGVHVAESHTSSPSHSHDSDDDNKLLLEPEARSIPTPASLDEITDGATQLDPSWPCLRMTHVPSDNLAFLRQKGAFKVPNKRLLVSLLTSYCNWIHPQLPYLDLSTILDAIFDRDGPKISPLLFQSIIYAGASHVPDATFQRCGYASRSDAQNVFFQRAKVLHDLDTENDLLVLSQATLLLSINHQCSKTSTVWLAHSHLTAQRLGLDRPSVYTGMRGQRAKLCKRLWWSMFLRDNTLRLELGTPRHFQDVSPDMPALTEDCFDITEFPTHLKELLPDASIVVDQDIHRKLMLMSVRRAELATHLAHILSLASQLSESISSNTTASMESISVLYENQLRGWLSRLNKDTQFSPRTDSHILAYHSGLLSMLYLSASNALLQHHLAGTYSSYVDLAVRSQMENDTERLLDIARILYQTSSTCFPPTLGMGLVYNAINRFIALADWRRLHAAPSLVLNPAIKCLCALIKSTPRGTAVAVALAHLEAKIKALDIPLPSSTVSHAGDATDRVDTLIHSGGFILPNNNNILSGLQSPADSLLSFGDHSSYVKDNDVIISNTDADYEMDGDADLSSSEDADEGKEIMSIEEIFNMAIRSDRALSPQAGSRERDEEEISHGLTHPTPGIMIPI
ncbi:hypothetical protein B0A52_03786 [Exophiala mesophila]|uniref:Zn(2)-C6 fungal-type domain-containing protein n=1 Tax=Exophiala mesophila TaxID=212818 RepID=A0A438N786_EXOME|nr:hypothetical protein B0A52_03786 [Exophiala mesophila]